MEGNVEKAFLLLEKYNRENDNLFKDELTDLRRQWMSCLAAIATETFSEFHAVEIMHIGFRKSFEKVEAQTKIQKSATESCREERDEEPAHVAEVEVFQRSYFYPLFHTIMVGVLVGILYYSSLSSLWVLTFGILAICFHFISALWGLSTPYIILRGNEMEVYDSLFNSYAVSSENISPILKSEVMLSDLDLKEKRRDRSFRISFGIGANADLLRERLRVWLPTC